MNIKLEDNERSWLTVLYESYKGGRNFTSEIQIENKIGEPMNSLHSILESLTHKGLIHSYNGIEFLITDEGVEVFEKFLKNEQKNFFGK